MNVPELPECWSPEWLRERPVRIRFRRGEGFEVQPEYDSADGRAVHVHMPRVMEAAEEGGHSLYAGSVCWDIVEHDEDLPLYLCESDFEWLGPPLAKE
jgi:hypothetical protein